MKHYLSHIKTPFRELILRYEIMSQSNTENLLEESDFIRLTDYYEMQKLTGKALEVIDFAIAKIKYSSQLHLRRARLLISSNRHELAFESLSSERNLNLRDSQIDLLKVESLISQRKYEKAFSVIAALKFNYKKDKKVLSELFFLEGSIFEKLRDFDKMYLALKNALWLNPVFEKALEQIWLCIEVTGKYRESIKFHERLIQKEHYSHLAWFNLGHAFYYESQYNEAIEAFEYSIIVNENFEPAYQDCAEVCMLMKKYDKALFCYEEIIRRFRPTDSDVYSKLSECNIKLGDTKTARKQLLNAYKMDSSNEDILFQLGESYRQEKKWKNAIRFYKRALDLDDNRDDVHSSLAKVYFANFEFELADGHFDQAIQCAPEVINYWVERASFQHNIGETALAENILEEGADSNYCAELVYCRAACLMILGQKQLSLELLSEALLENFQAHDLIFEFAPELTDHKDIHDIINYYRHEWHSN